MMSRIQPLFCALALPRDNRQSMKIHSTDTLCHTHIQYIRERGLYHALPSQKFTNDNIYFLHNLSIIFNQVTFNEIR